VENNRGVVYLFTGIKFAERMVVSLTTLRDHWDGPVTVCCTEDDCAEILGKLGSLNLNVMRTQRVQGKRSSYLTKPLIPTWTPYQQTVFIDGDTLVEGRFDELFEAALTITQFGDWISTGRRMSGRISGWRGLSPRIDELVRQQLSREYPAINTGVFGFHKGYIRLAEWHEITQAGMGKMMTDELAMQLLHGDLPECRVVDDRFNCSPLYGARETDVRIRHCHGNKHIKKPQGLAVWWPAFERCYRENVGGLRKWAGQFDKEVRGQLKKTPVKV